MLKHAAKGFCTPEKAVFQRKRWTRGAGIIDPARVPEILFTIYPPRKDARNMPNESLRSQIIG